MSNVVMKTLGLLILVPLWLFAQNALVNIKGTVLDERTGKPLGHEMDMIIISEKTGKKFVVKVNSSTGEYIQPLESGHAYSITFSSYAIYRSTARIEIPPMQKFKELTYNFTVRSLKEGEPLAEIRAFDAGRAELSPSAKPDLERILQLLKDNRQMRIVVEVARELEPPPPPPPTPAGKKSTSAKQKKGAKTQPQPTPPPPSPAAINTQLYSARIEALKTALSDIRDAEVRIQYRPGPEQPAQSSDPNVRILTGPVKSIFDE
jgi:hypothetical protein